MTIPASVKRWADELRASRARAWATNPNPSPLQRMLHEAWQRSETERLAEEAQRQPTPRRTRTRKPSLATRIRQATKAGLAVTAIRPDDTLITGKAGETIDIDAEGALWDETIRNAH
jgi:hypothetical protein